MRYDALTQNLIQQMMQNVLLEGLSCDIPVKSCPLAETKT